MDKCRIFIVSTVLIVLIACNKEESLQLPTATLSGIIRTTDEFGYLVKVEGIIVDVTDGVYTGTTFTDRQGRYSISGIPTGVYDITLTREGFGTRKNFSRLILGGNLPVYFNENMSEISSTRVLSFQAVADTLLKQIKVSGTINISSTDDSTRFVAVFLNSDSSVSFSNYKEYHDLRRFTGSTFSDQFKTDLVFSHGDTAYLVAYGVGFGGLQGYFEPGTRRNYFTNLNPYPSEKVMVIVP